MTAPRFAQCALFVSAFLLGSVLAAAAQDGLYAPAAGDDVAFVRIANVDADPGRLRDIGPVRFAPVAPGSATAYRPLQPDFFIVGGRRGGVMFEPQSGGFYTVIVTDQGITLIEDVRHEDPARAQLVFYNVSSQPLDLEAEGAGTVFSAVAPGERAVRTVNAVPVSLVARTSSTGAAVHEVTVDLARGQSDAIIVSDEGGFRVRATVETR